MKQAICVSLTMNEGQEVTHGKVIEERSNKELNPIIHKGYEFAFSYNYGVSSIIGTSAGKSCPPWQPSSSIPYGSLNPVSCVPTIPTYTMAKTYNPTTLVFHLVPQVSS
ncbi:hypothetical protein CDL15_Pgr010693 [Punica granatum]|nr:hypothetical protein CDL15_Pgr010693 [Punica granatum]